MAISKLSPAMRCSPFDPATLSVSLTQRHYQVELTPSIIEPPPGIFCLSLKAAPSSNNSYANVLINGLSSAPRGVPITPITLNKRSKGLSGCIYQSCKSARPFLKSAFKYWQSVKPFNFNGMMAFTFYAFVCINIAIKLYVLSAIKARPRFRDAIGIARDML